MIQQWSKSKPTTNVTWMVHEMNINLCAPLMLAANSPYSLCWIKFSCTSAFWQHLNLEKHYGSMDWKKDKLSTYTGGLSVTTSFLLRDRVKSICWLMKTPSGFLFFDPSTKSCLAVSRWVSSYPSGKFGRLQTSPFFGYYVLVRWVTTCKASSLSPTIHPHTFMSQGPFCALNFAL